MREKDKKKKSRLSDTRTGAGQVGGRAAAQNTHTHTRILECRVEFLRLI